MLLNSYVIHAENPASVHIANLRSLKHDAVLVLASSTTTKGREWRRPDHIDTTDSEAFVRDCAAALGWMLRSHLVPGEIHAAWTALLP